jgi:L-cysteine:1D-myo-inositol 2-amino-2-deoxy-alpha-D-glucopyranoside ligase
MDSWTAPPVPRLPGRGHEPRVFDTATRELRSTAAGSTATAYVCGITPYDATHLGHAATYVTFDTLARVWRDAGHDVRAVQNVTDVDDPLLERAAQTGEDWAELARRETALFRADMAALRVLPPAELVGVVEALDEIVELIGELVERGATYDVDGDLYFAVGAARRFGEVAHLDVPTMLALSGERGGDPDRPGKKDPLDALLWQAQRPGQPGWDSPYGRGRPGWHTECAAIALRRIGATVDVQGGGTDLAFPHHELTAAQASTATGAWPFARAFAHQAMVGLDGEKMSKSRGNLVLVSRLLAAGAEPAAVRLALLDHHYRTPWDWTAGDLDRARARLARWREAVSRSTGPPADRLLTDVRRLLADDLRTPTALEAVDRWARETTTRGGRDAAAPAQVRDLADALLGIAL